MGLLWSGTDPGQSLQRGIRLIKIPSCDCLGPGKRGRQLSRYDRMLESPEKTSKAQVGAWLGGGASRVFKSLQVMAHTE